MQRNINTYVEKYKHLCRKKETPMQKNITLMQKKI